MNKTQEALKLALEALEYIDRQDNDRDFLSPEECCDLDDAITAIRKALAEQPAQQQGWKLVPVEPTPEMLKAADDGDDEYTRRNFGPAVHRVMQGPHDHYIAMLNAAPQPARQQEPVAKAVVSKRKTDEHHITDIDLTLTEAGKRLSSGEHCLYTSPPASKPWVGLTDEEMHECWGDPLTPLGMKHARAIEAKLREKNA